MKLKWYKQLSLVVVIAILVSMLPVYAFADEVGNEPELTEVILDYVKSTDKKKLFNSDFKNFIKNPKVYEAEGKQILRVEVTTQYSLEFKVEDASGTLQLGNVVGTVGPEGSPTFNIRDYELPADYKTEYALSTVTYYVPMGPNNTYVGNHEQYLVFNSDVTTDDRNESQAAITTAQAIQQRSEALTNALAAAEELNIMDFVQVDYQERTENLIAVTKVNEGVSYEELERYGKAYAAALAVKEENKDQSLLYGIEQAKSEVYEGNDELTSERLVELTDYLTTLAQNSASIVKSLKPATLDYVKSTDKKSLFNNSFVNFIKNAKVYEVGGKTYLRVEVTTQYDLEFKVENEEGDLESGTVVGLIGPESNPTFKILDYELPTEYTTDYALSTVHYVAQLGGGRTYTGNHEQYLVFNSDVNQAARTAAQNAIITAQAIQQPSQALSSALEAANELNIMDHVKSDYDERIAALVEATKVNKELSYEELELYGKAYAAALKVDKPEAALVELIETAEQEVFEGNDELTSERLNELTIRLNELVGASSAKAATVDFVKTTNLNELNNEALQNIVTKFQTYSANGQTYVRVYFAKKDNLEFKLTDKKVNLVSNGENEIVYDFSVYSLNDAIESKITFTEGEQSYTYNQYLVVNQDATDTEREALKAAIAEAEAVKSKGSALREAIKEAKAKNNLVTRKQDLINITAELKEAIKNNSTSSNGQVQIHEESGLEVGKYTVSVTAYQSSDDGTSTMNQYIVDNARLNVTKSKLTVELPLSDTEMIKGLWVEGKKASISEKFKNPDVAYYKFDVSTLTGKLDAAIHVVALVDGEVLYDTTHSIKLGFGTPSKVSQWEDNGWEKGGSSNQEEEKKEEEPVTPEETKPTAENETGATTTATTPKITDIDVNWAKSSIERAVKLKLVNGYNDGTFKPNATINRAEFTAILARALKLEEASGELQFADADTVQAWAKPYIQQAVEAGIINGFADQTFRPSANITRIELAVMLVKGLGLENEQADEISFKDAADIPAWAKSYVAIAVKHGLIKGNADGSFKPNQAATRAEAIVIALRAVDFINKANH